MARAFPPLLAALAALTLMLALHGVARSHCEVPCGIYDDRVRIDLLYENATTVEKAMQQIANLSSKEGIQPLDVNQIVRWTTNKEEHANNIQHIATQYFMTQRVKPKAKGAEGHEKYIEQLTTLHEMLIEAMKSKQTVDPQHVKNLRSLTDRFAAAYFSAEELEHIRKDHHKE